MVPTPGGEEVAWHSIQRPGGDHGRTGGRPSEAAPRVHARRGLGSFVAAAAGWPARPRRWAASTTTGSPSTAARSRCGCWSPQGARGVIVYLHGGGWVIGTIDEFDTLGPQARRAHLVRGRARRLPPRPRAPLPDRGRRLLRRARVGGRAPRRDRRPRRRAADRRRRQRRREPRRGHGPARPRPRRPAASPCRC